MKSCENCVRLKVHPHMAYCYKGEIYHKPEKYSEAETCEYYDDDSWTK